MSPCLQPMLAALLLAAAPAPAPDAAPAPFRSLAELDAAMVLVERGGDVEAFWARVKAMGTMPLIFGDTAVFLHRTAAAPVEWRGDFTDWEKGEGYRIGQTDVWTFRRTFHPEARLDYKIVEGGGSWITDPLNPARQAGGFGANSELRMPGWIFPSRVVRKAGVAAGDFGPPELIESRRLGYGVTVRTWVARRPEGAAPRLPILYVTDGSDYWSEEMGGLTATLDNLEAEGRLPPMVVVFVDAWDERHRVNRRVEEFQPNLPDRSRPVEACPFCDFLVEELIPRVEARYPIDGERRGILGTSYGGFHAALMGLRHPDRFRMVGIQSPAIHRQTWFIPALSRAARLPRRVAIDVGLYEAWAIPGARALRDAFSAKGAAVRYQEVPDGHSWGHWRATVGPMLEFLYGER